MVGCLLSSGRMEAESGGSMANVNATRRNKNMNSGPLMHYIVEVCKDAEVYRVLAVAVPNYGRMLLREKGVVEQAKGWLTRMVVFKEGGLDERREWRLPNGWRHRDEGLPAFEWADGTKAWWVDGKLHRSGGLPAFEWADGHKEWWVDGKRHRDGGLPAIEWVNGTKAWWVDGKMHRDGGLPAFVWSNGHKEWWVDGKRHRGDGLPAVEWNNGSKEWWVDGECVR